jgi:chorismate synthase
MRWLTAGESHGQALSAIVEGIPASVKVTTADIDYHLERRRLGVGRGARQNFEADKVTILGGVRLGLTQGGPIAIQVGLSGKKLCPPILSLKMRLRILDETHL